MRASRLLPTCWRVISWRTSLRTFGAESNESPVFNDLLASVRTAGTSTAAVDAVMAPEKLFHCGVAYTMWAYAFESSPPVQAYTPDLGIASPVGGPIAPGSRAGTVDDAPLSRAVVERVNVSKQLSGTGNVFTLTRPQSPRSHSHPTLPLCFFSFCSFRAHTLSAACLSVNCCVVGVTAAPRGASVIESPSVMVPVIALTWGFPSLVTR